MPFPFVWVGAVVATAVLTAVITAFVTAMLVVDRLAADARTSIMPGLVRGIDRWSHRAVPEEERHVSPFAADPDAAAEVDPVEEVAPRHDRLERVRRGRGSPPGRGWRGAR